MRIVLLTMTLMTLQAYAGVGEDLPLSQVPVASCMLALETKPFIDDRVMLEEVCSGVMISPVEFLTAGHCIDSLDKSKAKIYCPLNPKPLEIADVEASPFYQKDIVKYAEEERWRDVAKITLKSPALVPSVSLVKSEEEALTLVSSASECAFFGFSLRLGQELKTGMMAQGVKVAPRALRFSESKTIWLDGGRSLGSLVGMGDSGGGLACRRNNQWTFFGVTSARDYDYGSIFGNLALHGDFIVAKHKTSFPEDYGRQEQAEASQNFQAKEVDVCWSKLEKAQDHYKRPVIKDLAQSQKLCESEHYKYLQSHIGQVIQLKTYSAVILDLHKESLKVADSEAERLMKAQNPFSSVDLRYNRFLIKKVENGYVEGDLKILGFSDGFGCTQNFLCQGGVYENVRVPWNRLDVILHQSF